MANPELFLLKAVVRDRFMWYSKATRTQIFKRKICEYDVLCVTHRNAYVSVLP
jgi:hypothetical protein